MLCLCLREAPVLPPLPDLTLGWIRLRMQKIGLEKEKKNPQKHENNPESWVGDGERGSAGVGKQKASLLCPFSPVTLTWGTPWSASHTKCSPCTSAAYLSFCSFSSNLFYFSLGLPVQGVRPSQGTRFVMGAVQESAER